jgi:hypothetical protein
MKYADQVSLKSNAERLASSSTKYHGILLHEQLRLTLPDSDSL